jgi:hypothetical protein
MRLLVIPSRTILKLAGPRMFPKHFGPVALGQLAATAGAVPVLDDVEHRPIGWAHNWTRTSRGLECMCMTTDDGSDNSVLTQRSLGGGAVGVMASVDRLTRLGFDDNGFITVTQFSLNHVTLLAGQSESGGRIMSARRVNSALGVPDEQDPTVAEIRAFHGDSCPVNTGSPCQRCSTDSRLVTHRAA